MKKGLFSPSKKRILITGASGLIGRCCFEYLSKNPAYEVYGADKQLANSERYKMDHKENAPIPTFPEGKFFLLDITQKEEIFRILNEHKIDVVVHLAAVLETQSIEAIQEINIEGTRNIYDACVQANVKRVIFASSIMLYWDYFKKEPYLSIKNGDFNGDSDDIPLLTPSSEIRPATDNPSYTLYCESKLAGEKFAESYANHNQLSSICARFCAINVADKPTTEYSSIWCSQRDACSFVQRAIESEVHFGIYFVCSNNTNRIVDITNPFGFTPKDGASYTNTETLTPLLS